MIGNPVHVGFDGETEDWANEGIIGDWESKDVEEPSEGDIWNMEWGIDREEAETSSSKAIGKDSLYSEYSHRFFPKISISLRKEDDVLELTHYKDFHIMDVLVGKENF